MGKVTLKYIEQHIDKSEDNTVDFWDVESLAADLGIYLGGSVSSIDVEDIKCYRWTSWHDTDQFVGTNIYFYQNKLVAISHKTGRKSATTYQWVSGRYEEVRRYLNSFTLTNNIVIDTLYMDDTIENEYSVHFTAEVSNHMWERALYKDAKFEIREFVQHPTVPSISNELIIVPEGADEQININVKDVKFKANYVPSKVTEHMRKPWFVHDGIVLSYYYGNDFEVDVPEGIECITPGAFHENKYLETVNLPTSLCSIYDSSFHNCYNLKKVVVNTEPDQLYYGFNIGFCIYKNAFAGCDNLEAVYIPNDLKDRVQIEPGAFGNRSIEDVVKYFDR